MKLADLSKILEFQKFNLKVQGRLTDSFRSWEQTRAPLESLKL